MPATRRQRDHILRWKAKFGGLAASDAKRLRQLEAENTRLKRPLAESHLDNAALKDMPPRKAEVMIELALH